MATMNWDDLESAHEEASKPAPAGRYILQVKSMKLGESKNKDPQVQLVWEIAEGPYKGKVAFDYLTFNPEKPNTISMSRNVILMLGFKDLREWGATAEQERINRCVGKRIEADLTVDEYQGRVSNKVKQKIRAIGGSAVPGGPTPPPAAGGVVPPPAPPVNPMNGI